MPESESELYVCRKVQVGRNPDQVLYRHICSASEFYAQTYEKGRASVIIPPTICSRLSAWFNRLSRKKDAP